MTFLVADIGGTNARFALCDNDKTLLDDSIRSYICSQYSSIFEALEDYLKAVEKPTSACLAIATPITDDEISFTNNPWSFSKKALQNHYAFKELHIVNDFRAIAHSIPALQANDYCQIGTQVGSPNKPIGVLGPGTGFGNAILLPAGSTANDQVICTEGGHSGFAPSNAIEMEIFQWALQKHIALNRENFISGIGFRNIYRALCEIQGIQNDDLSPADISKVALEHCADKPEHVCKQTLDIFCSFLGNVAGDQALSIGAKGGIYIAGGIVKRFINFIETSAFRSAFENKGIMSDYVKAIPSYIITTEYPGLIGASAYLKSIDSI